MKTNISRFIAVSALALTLPMTALAFGRDNHHSERGGDNRPGYEMRSGHGMASLRGIDLSAAQVTQLSALRDEQKKTFTDKGQGMRDQHDALHKLVMSDAYTPAAAAEIIAKISTAQNEMAKLRAEQGNKLYKILTPEQRTKMQQNELTGRGSMGHGHMR